MAIAVPALLALLAVTALPAWNHSRRWGYGPSAAIALVFLIVLALLALGRI